MPLNYDFDVCSQVSREIFSDDLHDTPQKLKYIDPNNDTTSVVQFRDPKTAAAFRALPGNIRKIFYDSRFGASVSQSSIPKGYYLNTEENFRTKVFQKLEKNLSSQLTDDQLDTLLTSQASSEDEFNVSDFINAATSAKTAQVPQFIAARLQAVYKVQNKRLERRAFYRALAPRLAFMFYMFIYGTTQLNAMSLF